MDTKNIYTEQEISILREIENLENQLNEIDKKIAKFRLQLKQIREEKELLYQRTSELYF